jgi:hypothetical protein
MLMQRFQTRLQQQDNKIKAQRKLIKTELKFLHNKQK